jgi:hypothetical protein
LEYLVPWMVHTMRAFLSLVGYYCRFIHDYGAIDAPLTKLLLKEGLWWSPEAEEAFYVL